MSNLRDLVIEAHGGLGRWNKVKSIHGAAKRASKQADCMSDHYTSSEYRKHLVRTEVARALSSLKT